MFIVIATNNENQNISYIVGLYSTKELAKEAQEIEEDNQDGEYTCEYIVCEVDRLPNK